MSSIAHATLYYVTIDCCLWAMLTHSCEREPWPCEVQRATSERVPFTRRDALLQRGPTLDPPRHPGSLSYERYPVFWQLKMLRMFLIWVVHPGSK